jgi:hypothetical protein
VRLFLGSAHIVHESLFASRLKRGSGYDLTSLWSPRWLECSVRNGQACPALGLGSGGTWRECGGVEKERGRVRKQETAKRVNYTAIWGLVTAVVAKHTVCNCLGDSSLVSLGLLGDL